MRPRRLTRSESEKVRPLLSPPSELVQKQIDEVPDLLLLTFPSGSEEERTYTLFLNKEQLMCSEEFDLNEFDMVNIGERLEGILAEEFIQVQLEWRAFGRAASRLLGKETEFDAYIRREGDFYPVDWLHYHHDNVYMLAYYIQHHESHPYMENSHVWLLL